MQLRVFSRHRIVRNYLLCVVLHHKFYCMLRSPPTDVIRGKLDQRGGALQVEYAAGRDVRPEAVPRVIATLQAWCRTCDAVMECIDRQVQTANGEREARAKHKAAIEAKVGEE